MVLRSIFGRTKTLNDLKEDDLKKETTRLELSQQSLAKQLRQMEAQKTKIFNDAVRGKGTRVDDRIAAQKMETLRMQINDVEREASDASRQVRAVGRLLRAKRHQKQLDQKGLWADISKMSAAQLGEDLTDWKELGEEQRQRIAQVNDILGIDEETLAADDSPILTELMDKIAAARESGMSEEAKDAFDRAAGSWKGTLDFDAYLKDLYASRKRSSPEVNV